MIQRLIISILVIPAIGCAGEALAQGVDPVSGLLASALAAPGGISWPLAAVVGIYIISRELRRGCEEIARTLHDWRPPTITLRLDDTRARPIETRTRSTDGVEAP
jgi:hypothetical protein